MAKAQQIKVVGPIQWAKLFEFNRDMFGPYGDWGDEFGGMYQAETFLVEEEEEKLKKAGSAKKVKDPKETDIDAPGNKYTFQRKHEGPFDSASGPPKVLKKNGAVWDPEEDGLIGNGSICEFTLTIYQTKHPKRPDTAGVPGTRLETVRVLDHVAYVAPDFEDRPEEPEQEREEEPEVQEEKPAKKKPAAKKKSLPDDDIPF